MYKQNELPAFIHSSSVPNQMNSLMAGTAFYSFFVSSVRFSSLLKFLSGKESQGKSGMVPRNKYSGHTDKSGGGGRKWEGSEEN